jgi:hypothetical protein
MFFFDSDTLQTLAAAHAAEYRRAKPFPHIALDGVLPDEVLDAVLTEFPSKDGDGWRRWDDANQVKLARDDASLMGDATRQLLAELNSASFINFLEQLTGIAGLIPDPHLAGGGLHQIVRGGHLDVHIDFNRHKRMRLDRRLNLLIYLNRDWQPEWGGAFELWSAGMERCEAAIPPLFNRLVVFSTSEISYHGHPHPLNCPEDRTRRSIAMYYYSAGRPEEGDGSNGAKAHTTLWASQGRPAGSGRRERVKQLVDRWAPPAVLDAVKAARERRARS